MASNSSPTFFERIIQLIAGIITVGGFLYALYIQNLIDIGVPNLSEYPFFIRSAVWIIGEGLFAIGFAYLIVMLSTYTVARFHESNHMILIAVPILTFVIFVSAWQTIIVVRHFFDTSQMTNDAARLFGSLIRNIVAYGYSVSILWLHSNIVAGSMAANREMANAQYTEEQINTVGEQSAILSLLYYSVMYWFIAISH